MPIREILQLGDPRLRVQSEPVDDPGSREVAGIARDLSDTLDHWRKTTTYGRAISAPQIAVAKRIVFMNVDQPLTLVNPRITDRSSEEVIVWDTCLSFLSIFFQVHRSRWIRVQYQEPDGRWTEMYCDGDLSELLQHEIDHLDGILSVDHMVSVETMCTRDEFEKRYRTESPYVAKHPVA